MRVRYTVRARQDLVKIFTELDQRNPTAAQVVKDLIERSIRRLDMFPLLAPLTDEPGVHELSIVRYRYKVYYELSRDEEVWILHIRDTRRKSLRATGA
jgi:plasmid stabilization system protein ParE